MRSTTDPVGRRSAIAMAAGAVLSAGTRAASAQATKAVSFQLSWVKSIQYGGLFGGMEIGSFKQAGVDPTFVAGGLPDATGVWYGRVDFLDANRPLVVAMLRGAIQGWTWALAHPDETARLMVEKHGAPGLNYGAQRAEIIASKPYIEAGLGTRKASRSKSGATTSTSTAWRPAWWTATGSAPRSSRR